MPFPSPSNYININTESRFNLKADRSHMCETGRKQGNNISIRQPIIIIIIIIIFTLGIKDPERFEKKLEENCRSDHYSGQSSNTKKSCSSTPLNRCTSTEMRWNKKAVSRSLPEWWLIFFARSEKNRGRFINWAESRPQLAENGSLLQDQNICHLS